jgi:hypothetical protein
MPRFRTFLLAGLLAFVLGAGSLAVLWHRGTLQGWIERRVVDTYVRKIQPHVPFVIEEARLQGSWGDLKARRISRLSAVVRWGSYRARLSGPILLEGNDNEFSAEYQPETTLELAEAGGDAHPSPPLKLELEVSVARNFSELAGLRVQVETAAFAWPGLPQATAKDFLLEAVWNAGEDLDATLRASALHVELPEKQVNLTDLDFDFRAPATLKPLSIGPTGVATLKLKGFEGLFGDRYFDLPLARVPVKATFDGRADAQGLRLRGAQLDLAQGALTIAATLPRDAGGPKRFRWSGREIALGPVLEALVAGTSSAGAPLTAISARLADFKVSEGTLRTQGALELGDGRAPTWSASASLHGLALRNSKLKLALRGADLELPTLTHERVAGTLAVPRVGFRHAKARLERLALSARKQNGEWSFSLGAPGSRIPLAIEGLPLQLDAIQARATAADGLQAETALRVPTAEFLGVAKMFCLPTDHVPPSQLTVDFSKVALSRGDIDPTGFAEIRMLDGSLRVEDIGLFDFDTEVPEVDFSARLQGVRLDRIGEWLGFGEMDGVLQGYAKDVTFQSWFPTHFDFKLEVKPLNHWKVVFSPDAMRNVVTLFAGEGLNELPGFANWLAFGWPSRVFGGYDVLYAGASVFSSEGSILLETLDPRPAGGEHYLLYGPRFRIPLKSSHYPLVMDATSMGNFIRQMSITLKGLAKQKAEREALKNPAKTQPKTAAELEGEKDESCQPE